MVIKLNRFIVILVSAALFTACGSDTKPGNLTPSDIKPSTATLNSLQEEKLKQTPRPQSIAWQQIEDKKNQFEFTCDDCPSSFGQIVAQWTGPDPKQSKPTRIQRSYNCQGGLIDSKHFGTNRHCLPEDLQVAGADCDGRIKVIFPKTSSDNEIEVAECKSIKLVSSKHKNIQSAQPDWVIIELADSYPDRSHGFSDKGIADGTTLMSFAPVVDPATQSLHLQTTECTSILDSYIVPFYTDPLSPIVRLKCNKDMTKGFSGSVLFAKIEDKWLPTSFLSHIWDTPINGEKILVTPFIVASNLACIPFDKDLENYQPPAECEFDPSLKQQLRRKQIFQKLEAELQGIEKVVEDFTNSENQALVWQKTQTESVSSMPASYQAELRTRLNKAESGFADETIKQVFTTLVPHHLSCLKAGTSPSPKTPVYGRVPVVDLAIYRDENERLQSKSKIYDMPVRINKSPEVVGRFVLSAQASLPNLDQPENTIISDRFHHLSASLTTCSP